MKRYITSIVTILCILCGIAGCIKEDYLDNGSIKTSIDPNSVLLTLQSGKKIDNRVVTMEHNEDLLKTVSVFFFPANVANSTLEYFLTNVEVNGQNQVEIPLEADMNDKEYNIYVIANYDITSDADIKGDQIGDINGNKVTKEILEPKKGVTTIEALKTLVLTTIFNRQEDGEEPSFVMDGQVETPVKLELGTALEKSIELERVASRIQLYANFKDFTETKEGGQIYEYTALTGTAKVTLYNAIGRTSFSNSPLYGPTPSDIMNPRVRSMEGKYVGDADDKKNGYFYNELPFYSYANDWSHESSLATYLELSVDWKEKVGTATRVVKYYYQVPITIAKQLVRNNAYQITVDVSMSGSETPTEAVTLNGDLEVIPWTEVQFTSDLNRYKYLSVDPQMATLYNTASAQFKYSSSSPIKVEITKVSYIDYSTQDNLSDEIDNPQEEGFKVYVVGNEIHFDHKINKEKQFYPYTITLKVTNEDEGVAPQIVTIVQYPSIYVSAEQDEDITTETTNGHRFVYNKTSGEVTDVPLYPSGTVNLGNVISLKDSEDDKNPNQYTIHITAFDETDRWMSSEGKEEPYMIGDPRKAIGDGSRIAKLTDKYQASKQDVSSQATVAPIFKIASSWGGHKGFEIFSVKQAEYRCSAYQENGYPAGRWRLPTEAEIKYILDLSEEKKQIPRLFLGNSCYVAASGKLWHSGKQEWTTFGQEIYGFVRCVYDVWYWGDEPIKNKSKFVWGDDPNGSLRDFNGDPYSE